MSTELAAIGFESPPRTMIPYSVSTPSTLCKATRRPYRSPFAGPDALCDYPRGGASE